ncbi:SMI1/KNR4 family protein [Olleya sp. HaHaR_3_96]|uniref:SMI1/KNR4 family protein n=1 Tax=Olleya sp. HaHaR_3_96 TaxID=2745560 RepID=UPI001C4E76C2|nr:SMI1/KNR4 family protein [Olleya sp. HaHaR_3_96]QXP58449.1 SMI1/KNR4 family protein [Olleya sp. HaHaR_3_96]
MEKLNILEKTLNLTFPSTYRNFYIECQKSIPKGLIGTDLYHDKSKLKEWALELLKEDNAENFLTENDFVFMMHQGYMFWYFSADGSENPNVYFYREMSLKPDKITDLKTFLSEYQNAE